jgi:hypothetical protein
MLTFIVGYPNTFKWLKDVHAGKRPVEGCKSKDIYVTSGLLVAFDLLPLVPSDMLVQLLGVLWQLLAPA